MKSPALVTAFLFLASACVPATAQHVYGHGHGGYYHNTPSAYTPPAAYTPPGPSAAELRLAEQRQEAARRAAEQRAIAAEAVRQRAVERAAESRRAMDAALDAIASASGRNASVATVAPADPETRPGYDCVLNQTGGMNCYRQTDMNAPSSFPGQQVVRAPETYSGSLSGGGYNSPAAQAERNNGPLPRGTWNVTGVQQTLTNREGVTSPSANVLRLEPAAGTSTFGRDAMRVHGDSRARPGDASNGCVITPPDVRSTLAGMVNQGGQVRIEVRR